MGKRLTEKGTNTPLISAIKRRREKGRRVTPSSACYKGEKVGFSIGFAWHRGGK